MQTDPIGYKDGINWYAYVGSDPINRTDSGGMQAQPKPEADPPPQTAPPKPANDNNKAPTASKGVFGRFLGLLGKAFGLASTAQQLSESNDEQNTLYRGLSGRDVRSLERSGQITANDPAGRLTPEQHALDSTGSQFISFTTDRAVAENFATTGPDPGGYVVTIDGQSAAMSGRLVVHTGIAGYSAQARSNVLSESEVLIIGPVPWQTFREMYRAK
jgi:hypothetical protein